METGNLLHIYCLTESIDRNALPWHFIHEKLSVFFDIPLDRKHLLSSILTTSDHDMIKDFLERANLLTDTCDRALDAQAWPDGEFDTDEESNVEVNGVDPVLQTPNRRPHYTPSSNLVDNSPISSPPAYGNGHTSSSGGARRVSSRLEQQVINVDSILRAADTYSPDDVHVLGPSVNQSARIGAQDLLRTSVSSSGTPHSRRSVGASSSPGRVGENGPSPSRSPFDTSTMSAALPILDSVGSQNSEYRAAGDGEKEIGYGGELYVRARFRSK